ncbi:hypothetical protein GQ42DRAFT_163871 [Ramicandelaber brevisporus]|nr:hypothetical protein GQ42DRAFT_163871 [Ramicandelaber brevisporus]
MTSTVAATATTAATAAHQQGEECGTAVANTAAATATVDDSYDDFDTGDLFAGDDDQSCPATPVPSHSFTSHTRLDGSKIRLRLPAAHSLWSHVLWNAARAFSDYIDSNPDTVKDRTVLELGSGSGLPSITAALNGAKRVIATDYPEKAILDHIQHNVTENNVQRAVNVQGYLWGSNPSSLFESASASSFDVVIMCDVIQNHSEQAKLFKTCQTCLKRPGGVGYVFFSHHRPWLTEKDMRFFDEYVQADQDFACEKIYERKMAPMFENDRGDADVRATVHGYRLTFKA